MAETEQAKKLIKAIPVLCAKLAKLQEALKIGVVPDDEKWKPFIRVASRPRKRELQATETLCESVIALLLTTVTYGEATYTMGYRHLQVRALPKDHGQSLPVIYQAVEMWDTVSEIIILMLGLDALLKRLLQESSKGVPLLWLQAETSCTVVIRRLALLRALLYTWTEMPSKQLHAFLPE